MVNTENISMELAKELAFTEEEIKELTEARNKYKREIYNDDGTFYATSDKQTVLNEPIVKLEIGK